MVLFSTCRLSLGFAAVWCGGGGQLAECEPVGRQPLLAQHGCDGQPASEWSRSPHIGGASPRLRILVPVASMDGLKFGKGGIICLQGS